jgi:shikimate dehydrogenase
MNRLGTPGRVVGGNPTRRPSPAGIPQPRAPARNDSVNNSAVADPVTISRARTRQGLQDGLEPASRVESKWRGSPGLGIHVKRAFVIGHPISHSRSPLIHSHWLAAYGVDGSYEAIDVAPSDLPAFIDRLRAGEFAGGNVTLPHKEAVFPLCDEVDPLATMIGAVNTLVVRDGRVLGTNTDYLGFLGNLDAAAPGWSDGPNDALIIGAGGAARAVLVALRRRDGGRVHVLNRTLAKAEALVEEIDGPFEAHGFEAFPELAPRVGLVVNTSSIGMHGSRLDWLDLSLLSPGTLVTDIVYVPLVTPLLADARAHGLPIVDGLGMLLHQAVPGFEAWFGVRPEVTPQLRAKVEANL